MAIKYFCDKCGKEIGFCSGADIKIENRGFDTIKIRNYEKELCNDCVEELKEWLNRTESK